MDFDQIALTKCELKMLKKAKSNPIPIDGVNRLERHGLVKRVITPVPGRFGIDTGTVCISDLGVDYLEYVDEKFREYRKTRVLSIIAIVISILTLVWQVLSSLLLE